MNDGSATRDRSVAPSRCKYDSAALRSWATFQNELGRSVSVPPLELLAVLDDLERYRHILERIVAWDYPCRDEWCEAGDVAALAFEEK